jgi:hypothetical protein
VELRAEFRDERQFLRDHLRAVDARSAEPRRCVALAGFVPPDGGRVPIVINVAGRVVKGDLNPKSVKKAVVAVAEHGADNVAVVLQGRLGAGDVIEEVGISAQPKAPKPPSV